mmetsp:Transcript_21305/g.45330  ORF Transcript_21305/g.45330 Transcript_21305/m.45330 type:complete len:240 (-) Transcript_21305:1151-1870(-)
MSTRRGPSRRGLASPNLASGQSAKAKDDFPHRQRRPRWTIPGWLELLDQGAALQLGEDVVIDKGALALRFLSNLRICIEPLPATFRICIEPLPDTFRLQRPSQAHLLHEPLHLFGHSIRLALCEEIPQLRLHLLKHHGLAVEFILKSFLPGQGRAPLLRQLLRRHGSVALLQARQLFLQSGYSTICLLLLPMPGCLGATEALLGIGNLRPCCLQSSLQGLHLEALTLPQVGHHNALLPI